MSIAQENKIDNSKFENFEVFVAEVFERMLAEGREIIRKTLSELDVQLMAARDTTQYRDKGLRSTSIKTKLGTIEEALIKSSAHIAWSDFQADCTKRLQEYCRISRVLRAI